MTRLERRRAAGAVIVLCLPALMLLMPGVQAQDLSIVISLPTVVEGEPGSQHLLATEDVPGDLVGTTCSARAEAENQSSVHPDNDLVVASDDDQIVLEDVEREPGAVTISEGSMVVGEQVSVTLLMGPDGIFSAGMRVELTCEPTTTTTTTETTSTTEAETTTTSEGTTTTSTVLGTTLTTSTTTSTTTTTTTITTTAPPTTDDDTTTTETTLPFTGISGGGSAGVALAALLVGAALVALTRRYASGGAGVSSAAVIEVEIEGVRVRLLRPDD